MYNHATAPVAADFIVGAGAVIVGQDNTFSTGWTVTKVLKSRVVVSRFEERFAGMDENGQRIIGTVEVTRRFIVSNGSWRNGTVGKEEGFADAYNHTAALYPVGHPDLVAMADRAAAKKVLDDRDSAIRNIDLRYMTVAQAEAGVVALQQWIVAKKEADALYAEKYPVA